MHRKGATRAFPPGHAEIPAAYRNIGQPVLVPGDMGRYSYVLTGTAGAYKDVADVVRVVEQAGLGHAVARLRPMAVIKGQIA